MPELPEVETVVRTLRPSLVGRSISHVDLARPDILEPRGADLSCLMASQSVQQVERRGKRILIRLGNGTLCIHLGMTGRLTIESPDSPRKPHTHLLVDFEPAQSSGCVQQMRFRDPRRFGGVWWLGPTDCVDAGLGPEPLSLRPRQLISLLSRTRRAVKTALLDQALIAGLGNIYVDESLFAAGIHPLTPANQLSEDEAARLNQSIKRILHRAIDSRGSSFRDYVDADGRPGGFQKLHRVYARENLPCVRCGTPIQRIVLGGRSTHFCPRCQPLGPRVIVSGR